MSANVAFPSGQGGGNTCSTTGGLGANLWAQYNGTTNGTNNNQMSGNSGNPNQGQTGGYGAAGDVTNDRLTSISTTPKAASARWRNAFPGFTIMTGYLYDADGTRVAKGTITEHESCDPAVNGFRTTSAYVLGPSGEQVTEMAMDPNGSMAWEHTNVWAGGNLLATYDRQACTSTSTIRWARAAPRPTTPALWNRPAAASPSATAKPARQLPPTSFHRQRTGYRIRKRLLRGQVLRISDGALHVARLERKRRAGAIRQDGRSAVPQSVRLSANNPLAELTLMDTAEVIHLHFAVSCQRRERSTGGIQFQGGMAACRTNRRTLTRPNSRTL